MKRLTAIKVSLSIGLALAFFCMASGARAATTVPNTFSAGTTISSSQMNSNFSALTTAIDQKTAGVEYNNTYNANCSPDSYDFCSGWLTTAVTNMGSISVTTPGAGSIILLMSGDVFINDDIGAANVGIGNSATNFIKSATVGRARVDYVNHLITYETFNVMHVVTVGSAGTYTYYALAQKHPTFNAAGVSVSGVKLIAIFVPLRY